MTVDSLPRGCLPSPHNVSLGKGLPTREELLVYYPAKFTWTDLKTFVNSGYVEVVSLGLLFIGPK